MSNFGNRNTGFFADSGSNGGGGEGTVTSVAALTLATTGTDLTSTVANSTTTPVITLNVPDASATARGVITTGAQTIAGIKAFSSNIKIPSIGSPLILSVASDGTVSGLSTSIYPSLTELSYVKGVTSTIQTQLNAKGSGTVTSVAAITLGTTGTDLTSTVATGTTTPVITLNVPDASTTARGVITTGVQNLTGVKSFASNTLIKTTTDNLVDALQVNGTISATNFISTGQTTYVGTPTWTGTPPSGATNFTYSWTQTGKCVTLRMNLAYSVAGSANTSVSMPLPSGAPTPQVPTGFSGNNAALYYGSGALATTTVSMAVGTVPVISLRTNSTSTGFEVFVQRQSAAYAFVYATIQYFTA